LDPETKNAVPPLPDLSKDQTEIDLTVKLDTPQ